MLSSSLKPKYSKLKKTFSTFGPNANSGQNLNKKDLFPPMASLFSTCRRTLQWKHADLESPPGWPCGARDSCQRWLSAPRLVPGSVPGIAVCHRQDALQSEDHTCGTSSASAHGTCPCFTKLRGVRGLWLERAVCLRSPAEEEQAGGSRGRQAGCVQGTSEAPSNVAARPRQLGASVPSPRASGAPGAAFRSETQGDVCFPSPQRPRHPPRRTRRQQKRADGDPAPERDEGFRVDGDQGRLWRARRFVGISGGKK